MKSPQTRVHDFVGLHRVPLADAHEDEVLEDAFRRQHECPLSPGKFILKMGRKSAHRHSWDAGTLGKSAVSGSVLQGIACHR
jgi:hypothetical protein